MEQDLIAQRQSRTAQFLAWLRGDQAQTQQQRQQSDRQVADGYTRGSEDPDARSAPSRSAAETFATQRERERGEARPMTQNEGLLAAMEAAQRRFQEQQRGRGETPAQTANDSRFAALEVAKRLREAQERSQNRQQGRGR